MFLIGCLLAMCHVAHDGLLVPSSSATSLDLEYCLQWTIGHASFGLLLPFAPFSFCGIASVRPNSHLWVRARSSFRRGGIYEDESELESRDLSPTIMSPRVDVARADHTSSSRINFVDLPQPQARRICTRCSRHVSDLKSWLGHSESPLLQSFFHFRPARIANSRKWPPVFSFGKLVSAMWA
ncbi:hypothetical protein C7974DRAFT_168778 [Boeremia exigua]|uniref:uncharacterized protein n=1 Tax=Boeremia exigua TaxID=749465 RepID=UPI001E8E9FA0|nr:uncharacterized protein C7974DRAFT_168778 [Boeremia exigua]KAH6633287.1 hypothetical protein C7974DRAFT_168778 [Boeremia exigua]